MQSPGRWGTAIAEALYKESKSAEVIWVINSLIAAGPKGAEILGTIAATEDPDLRRRAIRNSGIKEARASRRN